MNPLAVTLLAACAPEPLTVEAALVDGGVEVRASRPIATATLAQGDAPLGTTQLPAPSPTAVVLAPTPPGASLTVTATTPDGTWATAPVDVPAGCVRAELAIPAGQARWPATPGTWPVPVEDGRTPVALQLTASAPCAPAVSIDGAPLTLALPTAGAREVLTIRVGPDPVQVSVEGLDLTLQPTPVDREAARDTLKLERLTFPTDARGRPDTTRSADRIDLPPRWWSDSLAALGLGIRARDDQAPWAWQSVEVVNGSDVPRNVAVTGRILEHGAPSPAFDAVVRDHRVPTTRALVQVPAGGARTVTLPVYVDSAAIEGRRLVTRELTLTPLGADAPVQVRSAPLAVARGSGWATAGLAAAVGVSLAGWGGVLAGARRWLPRARTSDLVTVALFAAAAWVVGAAFQVVGTAIGWVLGPFTPFVMGLPDQAFRTCLLATLLTLLPRPGVLALATVTGFLLRGLTFGALHPTDLLYLGSAVAFLEAAAWASGLTRAPAWRDASRLERFARLAIGLGAANVAATAAGLVVSATLYRLYLATWYVGGLLLLPGLLYVAVGCALAVPFAEGLREVRR